MCRKRCHRTSRKRSSRAGTRAAAGRGALSSSSPILSTRRNAGCCGCACKGRTRCLLLSDQVVRRQKIEPLLHSNSNPVQETTKTQECSRMTMITAAAKPRTVNTPASLPACSYASGSMVLASIMSIAPPANVSTNDSSFGDALARKR